jgi:hypothetical protein
MFTIRRTDKFTTYLVPNTTHCGIGNGVNSGDGQTVEFTYDAWVCMDDKGLDDSGFVIDNKEFKVFFDTQKRTSLSCERLCYKAAQHFFKIASKSKQGMRYVDEVCVKIWGLPGVAYAEYKWTRSDSKRAAA